jgi:hypothetical protein
LRDIMGSLNLGRDRAEVIANQSAKRELRGGMAVRVLVRIRGPKADRAELNLVDRLGE